MKGLAIENKKIAVCFTHNGEDIIEKLNTVLEEKGIDFDVMLPLIDEMVRKVHTVHPKEAQTGPAARGDNNVMEAQMKLLDDPAMKEVYRVLSESISEVPLHG